jgi:hypothetical protein
LDRCHQTLERLPSPDIIVRLVFSYAQTKAQSVDAVDVDTKIEIETARLPLDDVCTEASNRESDYRRLPRNKSVTGIRFHSKTEDIPRKLAKIVRSRGWEFNDELSKATRVDL